jgi:hypothetical protein
MHAAAPQARARRPRHVSTRRASELRGLGMPDSVESSALPVGHAPDGPEIQDPGGEAPEMQDPVGQTPEFPDPGNPEPDVPEPEIPEPEIPEPEPEHPRPMPS